MQTSHSSKYVRYAFHVVIILSMLFSQFGLALGNSAAADPPSFWVFNANEGPGRMDIQGYDWPLDTLITMIYTDLVTPASFIRTATMEDHGWGGLSAVFNTDGITPHPGDVVTMTDETTTLTHTLTSLRLRNLDPWLDLVTGTSNPGATIWLGFDGGPNGRWITVGGDGTWMADFSVPGSNAGEDILDFEPGQHLMIQQGDDDGVDGISINVPNYTLHVNRKGDEVEGLDWLGWGRMITLTVDNDTDPGNGVLYSQSKSAGSDTSCGAPCFKLHGLITLAAGQYVSLTEGTVSKTVRISTLQINEVNVVNETLSGEAAPGSTVKVNISSQGHSRSVTANPASGAWSVDFKQDGGSGNPVTNIRPDDTGYVIQLNPDGSDDGTREDWNLPRIIVQPDHGWIKGEGWPVGNVISVSVNDPGVGSCSPADLSVTDEGGRFVVQLEPACDLHVGETVMVTDGITTKSSLIPETHFDTINETANTAMGRGPAGWPAIVYVRTDNSEADLDITVGPGGNWTANFNGLLVIHTILYTYMRVYDPDGDSIQVSLVVPNLQAHMDNNEVYGYNWPIGASVTLTIEDPNAPDYGPVSLSPVAAPGDDSQTLTQFTLGAFRLQPGQLIRMSDGNITKTHTVTDLLVTGINAALNTVSGTSSSGDMVEVGSLCDPGGCALRRVNPSGGTWLTDFTAAPTAPTPEEQYPYDIRAGNKSEAVQIDIDNDGTQRGWLMPYLVFLAQVLRSTP